MVHIDGGYVALRLWDTFGYHDKDRSFAFRGYDHVFIKQQPFFVFCRHDNRLALLFNLLVLNLLILKNVISDNNPPRPLT